ncbi:hypothetical protein BaRGS_00021548 [Batillaria attramentaria]|uniref:Uncharacterized protein n=1 Tax=Batillaria attramentaria TaxID=370345 RepID=A0ABD0KIY4_9CAEN
MVTKFALCAVVMLSISLSTADRGAHETLATLSGVPWKRSLAGRPDVQPSRLTQPLRVSGPWKRSPAWPDEARKLHFGWEDGGDHFPPKKRDQ